MSFMNFMVQKADWTEFSKSSISSMVEIQWTSTLKLELSRLRRCLGGDVFPQANRQ